MGHSIPGARLAEIARALPPPLHRTPTFGESPVRCSRILVPQERVHGSQRLLRAGCNHHLSTRLVRHERVDDVPAELCERRNAVGLFRVYGKRRTEVPASELFGDGLQVLRHLLAELAIGRVPHVHFDRASRRRQTEVMRGPLLVEPHPLLAVFLDRGVVRVRLLRHRCFSRPPCRHEHQRAGESYRVHGILASRPIVARSAVPDP